MKRIRTVGEREVAFTVRGGSQGGKRMVRLQGTEFVHRLMLHALPTGIKRIRHFGVLASACKGVKLRAARMALQMPVPNPQAIESAKAFMARVARIDVLLCPVCRQGRLHITAVLAGPGDCQYPRWHGVASEPGATLSSRLGVANQRGFAGHIDCCPGLRRALLRSSPL